MMKKHNNEDGSVSTILIGLLFSLTFSSVVIAFLLVQFYGVALVGNQAAIELPGGDGLVSGDQDYKTNSVTDNVNFVDSTSGFTYVPNIGRVLTKSPPSLWDGLYLGHITDTKGVYTITYDINNSVKGDYAVFARMNVLLLPYNERIDVTQNGFRIPNGIIDTVTSNFYPYPNANQVEKVRIKTVLDKNKGTLEFHFNNKLIFTKTGIADIPSILDNGATFYAGVASKTLGFTIERINSGWFNFSDSSIIGQLAGFFEILGQIVLWNVDDIYLPNLLNIIFIKTQLAGIVVCIIMIIRGAS
jgi:hypothetical protein